MRYLDALQLEGYHVFPRDALDFHADLFHVGNLVLLQVPVEIEALVVG